MIYCRMKELIIIRHGEADHMVEDLTGGWTDSHLTELGVRQAHLTGKKLGELLSDRNFQFYSSDQSRAVETSSVIAGYLNIQPTLAHGLRELNNGAGANLNHQDASRVAIPVTIPLVDWTPYPGAESWRKMSLRVNAFMESLNPEQETTLLVMHGGSANAAICWWLGLGIGETNIAFELEPCSISRFAINSWGERTIYKLNDTQHLITLADS